MISGAQHLSRALRADLERTFDAPVLDIYGLHETRPVAVSPDGGPFRLLPTRVHVEVVDPHGEPAGPRQRGELVITAGSNPLLPLVRYRAGDFGSLVSVEGRPAVDGLEGREDVVFAAADGTAVPCVDVTQLLQDAGARGWTVTQDAAGAVRAVICGGDRIEHTRRLRLLFAGPVTVEAVTHLHELGAGKPRRYRRI